MEFKTKPYLVLTKVVTVLKKEDQKFKGDSERVESVFWRNLTGMRLVEF